MTTARKRSSVQVITPEEPRTQEDKALAAVAVVATASTAEDANDVSSKSINARGSDCTEETSTSDFAGLTPSLENTRALEISILETIHELQTDSPTNKRKVISILNRSLAAISHWSLQAQLSQLENKTAWDSRLTVENNLIKKEVEFFKNMCLRENKHFNVPDGPPTVTKKVTKRRSKKNKSTETTPTSFKLVENSKPHPRMKRGGDNPSTNEFVRVFHLERY